MQPSTLIQKAQQILTALMLVLTLSISAQDLSQFDKFSDDQLINYMRQYESQGLTEDQLILAAKAKGASDTDIEKLRARLQKLKLASTSDFQGTGVAAETTFFGETKGSTEVKGKSAVFGASFFQKAQANQSPNLNPATPEQYQLGPGDQISIVLWGAASNVFQETINVNGQIVIDGIGPIGLSGKTVAQARGFLKGQLSAIFEGLGPQFKNTVQEVNLDISLLKARSIVISIVGQVSSPGAYTLNGFSSVLMALYNAGGVTDAGSYRNIQVLRNKKVVSQIDLYQYLVKGIEPTITLRDQDVVFVPYVGTQVTVSGGLRQNGIFELKPQEKISDLIQYAGGFSNDAFAGSVTLSSYDGVQVVTERITADQFGKKTMTDGALIAASLISEAQKNRVSIEGAVPVAGSFGLEQAKTVSALIALAQGLKQEALNSFALLYRTSGGNKETSLVSVDLKKALTGVQDPTLQAGDRLVILSEEALASEQKINISGLVKSPGTFDFFPGMTASNLIALADGIQDGADLSKVSIYRSTLDERGALTITSFEVSLNDTYAPQNPESLQPLQANDLVVLRYKEDFRPIKFVTIEGAVRYPGTYALKEGYSFQNLLQDAGGLTPQASKDGIYIQRTIDNLIKNKIQEKAQKNSLNLDLLDTEEELPTLKIAVNTSKTGLIPLLKADDKVFVLKQDNSITVQGAVQESTAMSYIPGRRTKYYIQSAGGFSDYAKKNKLYVIYQNQSVKGMKSFLFFKQYPKLQPGATVVVPQKPENTNKLSTQEIIGITTSIATLGVLVNSLIVK